jgi:hypothetical protein
MKCISRSDGLLHGLDLQEFDAILNKKGKNMLQDFSIIYICSSIYYASVFLFPPQNFHSHPDYLHPDLTEQNNSLICVLLHSITAKVPFMQVGPVYNHQ